MTVFTVQFMKMSNAQQHYDILLRVHANAEKYISDLDSSLTLNKLIDEQEVKKVQKSMDEFRTCLEDCRGTIMEEDSPHILKEYLSKLHAESRAHDDLHERFLAIKKKVLAKRQVDVRAQLLAANEDGFNSRKKVLEKSSMVNKSRDLTASLQRVSKLVAQELDRLGKVEEMLEEDSSKLDSTYDQHGTYKAAASNADVVLKEIQRQEKIDWIIVLVCLTIFISTAIYIIWKRTGGWFIDLSAVFRFMWSMINSGNVDNGEREDL